MRQKFVEVELRDGRTIQVLPGEVEGLRNAGLLMEEETQDKPIEQNESEREDPPEEKTRETEQNKRSSYQLPILTKKERRQRIRRAKKMVKAGYSIRATALKLNVSHTSIIRWRNNKWNLLEPFERPINRGV